jgi:predicted nucleotide-binding protein
MIASASWDKTVGIWLWSSNTLKLEEKLPGNPDDVYCVSWSHDGRFLASDGRKHTIVIRDDRGRKIVDLDTRRHIVTSLSFSRDGQFLASKSLDGNVRLWDCSNWQEAALVPADGSWPYTTVAFHPNNPRVLAAATAQDSEIQLWSFDPAKIKEMNFVRQRGKVFIGHGRSNVWMDLMTFLENCLGLPVSEFNRILVAGFSTTERLSEMLDEASFAFLVMTGEDEHDDGSFHPRMNVVHEAGLFQGRLGIRRAIILLEDGCTEFSNIFGLSQIRFPKGEINASGQMQTEDTVRPEVAGAYRRPSRAKAGVPTVGVAPLGLTRLEEFRNGKSL